MSKQKGKLTQKQKQAQFGIPAKYYESKRHKSAVQLNKELNKVEDSIRENSKDLAPEFSKTVDENFWDLV